MNIFSGEQGFILSSRERSRPITEEKLHVCNSQEAAEGRTAHNNGWNGMV
jgi:hypothetical protein